MTASIGPASFPMFAASLLHPSIGSPHELSILVSPSYHQPVIRYAFQQNKQSTRPSTQTHHFSESTPFDLCINPSTSSITARNCSTISKLLYMARVAQGSFYQETSHYCNSAVKRCNYSRRKKSRWILDGRWSCGWYADGSNYTSSVVSATNGCSET